MRLNYSQLKAHKLVNKRAKNRSPMSPNVKDHKIVCSLIGRPLSYTFYGLSVMYSVDDKSDDIVSYTKITTSNI